MREVAPLVRQFIGELDAVEGDVIDIACGSGQNGCEVGRHGCVHHNVVCANEAELRVNLG